VLRAAVTRKGRSTLPEAHSLKQMRTDIARASKRTGNPTSAASKRRDYAAAKLEDYIRRVVETAPPLTQDQRSRIAALVQGGGSNAAA
jgi:hypothetical protein